MNYRKFQISAIAAAVGMACSGVALAQQDSAEETMSDQYGTSAQGTQQKDMSGTQMSDAEQARYGDPDVTPTLISAAAAEDKKLTKFKEAVEAAGLTDALAKGGEFTIFAPTDDAFEALGDERSAELMSRENVEELRDVLRSHIVAGKVDAEQAKQLDEARVLTGDTVKLSTEGEKLHVANATVVDTNIATANLTIHTINEVIDSEWLDSMDDDEEEAE